MLESESAVSWIRDGGLFVHSPTTVSSVGPAVKISQAVKAANELTMEAWLKPANITQDGPARIITITEDYNYRNFQLGQAAELYDIRLRTTDTTDNGQPSLPSPYGAVTSNLTHVVYTRQSTGMARIYINSIEVAGRVVAGQLIGWDDNYRLVLANEVIGGRPWLGEFHLVAFYNRALTPLEINLNYQAGAHGA